MINTDYLKNLNKAQKEAVLQIDGPLLIVAGAGSGKTKVLTSRIAHIIKQKKAFPNQILAVTFTNKAAKEMRKRIEVTSMELKSFFIILPSYWKTIRLLTGARRGRKNPTKYFVNQSLRNNIQFFRRKVPVT